MQCKLHKLISYDVSIPVTRCRKLDSCAWDIRVKKDRHQIFLASNRLGSSELANNKLAQKPSVEVERSSYLDASALLKRAKNNPAWSEAIRGSVGVMDAPIPTELKETKMKEHSFFMRCVEAKKSRETTTKPDPKLQLLHKVHGSKYSSWREARDKENEAEGIKMKMWRKTPAGDPWRVEVRTDGVPVGYQLKSRKKASKSQKEKKK